MRLQVTIIAEYEISDDPLQRRQVYGEEDIAACANIDLGMTPEEILQISELIDYRIEPVR